MFREWKLNSHSFFQSHWAPLRKITYWIFIYNNFNEIFFPFICEWEEKIFSFKLFANSQLNFHTLSFFSWRWENFALKEKNFSNIAKVLEGKIHTDRKLNWKVFFNNFNVNTVRKFFPPYSIVLIFSTLLRSHFFSLSPTIMRNET